jgi:ribosomal protein S18 acetylase RimI-like enzyme
MSDRYRYLWTEGTGDGRELVDVMAPWVIDASRPFADWYFGEPDVAAEIIQEWMSRPTSELFAGRSIVYEDTDGGVAGCIISLSGEELSRCRAADFAVFCDELGPSREAMEVVEQVLAASRELFPEVADGDLYISRVGVDPVRRGRGIGARLVRHAMDIFSERGLRFCRLDVSADNHAAIRAYEAAGLETLATSHSPTAGLTYRSMGAVL